MQIGVRQCHEVTSYFVWCRGCCQEAVDALSMAPYFTCRRPDSRPIQKSFLFKQVTPPTQKQSWGNPKNVYQMLLETCTSNLQWFLPENPRNKTVWPFKLKQVGNLIKNVASLIERKFLIEGQWHWFSPILHANPSVEGSLQPPAPTALELLM